MTFKEHPLRTLILNLKYIFRKDIRQSAAYLGPYFPKPNDV